MVDFGGTFSVALGAKWIRILAKRLKKIRGDRAKEIKKIALQVTSVDPRALAKLYVEPNVQYINPADYDSKHTLERPFSFRFQINDFVSSRVTEKDGSHVLFILGDAGMGKTSALVMLRMSEIVGFWPKGLRFEMFKLGETTLQDLDHLTVSQDPTRTVLLLDSLDEDPKAFRRAKERLQDLLQASRVFHRVIITCRTQFFPQHAETEKDQDRVEKDGRIRAGGYYCNLVYLARFSADQVGEYLHKKFPFWSWYHIFHRMALKGNVRERAFRIVSNMSDLRMRPLLLSYIEDLLESNVTGTSATETYEALIFRWLLREVKKIKETTRKDIALEDLRTACEDLAFQLQVTDRNTLSLEEIEERIPEALKGSVEALDIGGRSLLNRTSTGEFRFAHRTIQEFLALCRILNSNELDWGQHPILFPSGPINTFLRERRWTHWSPNFRILLRNLRGVHLRGIDLSRVRLRGADLSLADLREANLTKANLNGADLSGADLRGALLIKAKLHKAWFPEARFFQSDLSGADLRRANLRKAVLHKTDLAKANLTGANLTKADLTDANLTGTVLTGADLTGAIFSDADRKALGRKFVDYRGAATTK